MNKAAPDPDYVNHCHLCGWPEGQPWITIKQAAKSLAITTRKLREMVHRGAFNRTIRVAHTWRIHHEALDAYIVENQDVIASDGKETAQGGAEQCREPQTKTRCPQLQTSRFTW